MLDSEKTRASPSLTPEQWLESPRLAGIAASVSRRFGLSAADRDDLLQEVALLVWRCPRERLFAAYVWQLAWHRALDLFEKRPALPMHGPRGGGQGERRILMRVALRGLPRRHQRVCHLLYYEGRTERETAAILDMSRGAIQAIAHRALEMMRGSAVSGQRSAVSGQRSAVSGQRSAVSGQRSAVSEIRDLTVEVFWPPAITRAGFESLRPRVSRRFKTSSTQAG